MAAKRFGGLAMLGAALVISAPLGVHAAQARARSSHHSGRAGSYPISYRSRSIPFHYAHSGHSFPRYTWSGGHLQCVPFARENTGIELSGNAANWWAAAEGVYERGARPEVGSILNFRATGRMRLGHVAVVSNVVNSRTIDIDQANWSGPGVERGGISHDISVVDVSPGNDWTQVRVALGHTDEFGSTYPTYGFIYDRPDTGTMTANAGLPQGQVTQLADTTSSQPEEVAEAEDDATPRAYHHRAWRHSRASSSAHVYSSARIYSSARVYRVHSRAEFIPHHAASSHRRRT